MTEVQVAIIISILSAVIAALSLGWNIYRDVIQKPKLLAYCTIKLITNHLPNPYNIIVFEVVNRGSGVVIIDQIYLRDTSILKKLCKKTRMAVLVYDWTNPLSDKIPKKIEIGERATFHFKLDDDCFLNDSYTQIGIGDSFGRITWTTKDDIKRMNIAWGKILEKNT